MKTVTFGDRPELKDELAALVVDGTKRATCWPADDPDEATPAIGERFTVIDGAGTPVAVIETEALSTCRFCDVDEAFAAAEGEDDRTLESWRRGHEAYFRRQGVFDPEMMLYCERFRLVEVLPNADELRKRLARER